MLQILHSVVPKGLINVQALHDHVAIGDEEDGGGDGGVVDRVVEKQIKHVVFCVGGFRYVHFVHDHDIVV